MRIAELLGQFAPWVGVGLLVLAVATVLNKKRGGSTEKPKAKKLLTEREQAMFFRLNEAFPELVVMPQVAFSALLTATTVGGRNTFDRKVADFVLCDKGFKPICVIELDDASHRTKQDSDAARDAMLRAAGYKTLRFKNVPDVTPLRQAVTALTDSKPLNTPDKENGPVG